MYELSITPVCFAAGEDALPWRQGFLIDFLNVNSVMYFVLSGVGTVCLLD